MTRAFSRGRWTAVLAVMGLFLLAPWPGHTAVPTAINYQGSLTDASGTPITATLDFVFSLYDSPAAVSALWSEDQSVTVTNGVFSVDLGTVIPFPPNLFTAPLYLGVTVVGDAEMTPRLPFRTVPFAFSAEQLVACAPGETNCDGACVDLQSDLGNCGTCGTVCTGGETCVGGTCTTDPDADADGWTVGAGDCDDDNAAVNPGAAEVCNDIDDNCDDIIDESGAIGETEWFADIDADGFGDPSISTFACSQPLGTVANGTDCDDLIASVNPAAAEVCNGVDDNCDATTDEGVCVCGNAVTEPFAGEDCDDGGIDTAGCDADCTVASCGDGTTNAAAGESCDDGGESVSCDADCTLAVCGDGVFNATSGEQCDDGGESVSCDFDCTLAVCGDTTLNASAGETCDDGNGIDSDDCTNTCQAAACGDGFVHNQGSGVEQCDDANLNDNDDCPGTCQLAVCGDGFLHNQGSGVEQCDDGNLVGGDGCSSSCTIE